MTSSILKWFVLLALVLFIVAVALFFFGGPSFSENQVILELEGPTQASVGDEVVYQIKYGNETNIELHDLRFKFIYPDESVIIKDGKIIKDTSETFEISELKSGESEEKEFRAFLVGDRGNIKNAKIELEFQAGGLRPSFQKNKTISTTLIKVPVSLTLVAPPKVVPGQVINYLLDYRNESDENIPDIKFEFKYPDGFEVQEQIPKPTEANTWSLSALKKSEGGRISVNGILRGKEGEIKTVSVSLKRGISGEFVTYQKASTSSLVSSPLLGVETFVNGSKNYAAHLGDKLQYTIRYKNNSKTNLIGLSLEVKLDGEMYDLSTLDTSGGFYDSSNGTILWNAGAVSDFASLSPNKSGDVTFSVNIKENFPSGGVGTRNFAVKTSSKLSTPHIPIGVDGNEVAATFDLVTRVSTRPTFLQIAYHNDPSFGSLGPLPLKTGEETVFTIHWQVANPGNAMNQSKIKATLPTGINWKNVVGVDLNQPEPTFNPSSSEVVWDIGILPQGVGVFNSKYEASFQVGIKPSIIEQAPVIIKNAKFTGSDSFTKEEIVINAPDLTTSDLVDRLGEGTTQ